MKIALSELKKFIREALEEKSVTTKSSKISERDNKWNFFHVSTKDLGDKFTFTPRIPKSPYEDMHGVPIEDTITKRTSWAPSIKKALEALPSEFYYREKLYVYAVENFSRALVPDFEDCPSGPEGNEYGPGFIWKKYAEEYLSDEEQEDAEIRKTSLRHCVPDSLDTQEMWSLGPVTGTKIGEIVDGKFVPKQNKTTKRKD